MGCRNDSALNHDDAHNFRLQRHTRDSSTIYHSMQVGHDQLGRPVIYSCLANVTDRKTEHNKMHMIATFEQVLCSGSLQELSPLGPGVSVVRLLSSLALG